VMRNGPLRIGKRYSTAPTILDAIRLKKKGGHLGRPCLRFQFSEAGVLICVAYRLLAAADCCDLEDSQAEPAGGLAVVRVAANRCTSAPPAAAFAASVPAPEAPAWPADATSLAPAAPRGRLEAARKDSALPRALDPDCPDGFRDLRPAQ